jgi:hypothetical protein
MNNTSRFGRLKLNRPELVETLERIIDEEINRFWENATEPAEGVTRIPMSWDTAAFLYRTLKDEVTRLFAIKEVREQAGEDGHPTLLEIRRTERIMRLLEGLAEEKEWDIHD